MRPVSYTHLTQRILVSDLNRRSVRSDVPPLPGLSPIGRLPLIEMDLEELTREKKDVLARWNGILSRREGRPCLLYTSRCV